MYSIKAAAFILPIPFLKKFVHNYWVLIDSDTQKVIAQLHGLATSRKNKNIVPIGYKKDHSLRAHHIVLCANFASKYGFSLSAFRIPLNETYLVYEGNDTLERWFKAVKAVEIINQLDLDYPIGGFSIPLVSTINSNTLYRTFAEVLDIEVYSFSQYREIGIQQSIYSQIKKQLGVE